MNFFSSPDVEGLKLRPNYEANKSRHGRLVVVDRLAARSSAAELDKARLFCSLELIPVWPSCMAWVYQNPVFLFVQALKG